MRISKQTNQSVFSMNTHLYTRVKCSNMHCSEQSVYLFIVLFVLFCKGEEIAIFKIGSQTVHVYAFIHALILVLRGLLCSIFDPETESKCTFFSTNNAYTVSVPKQSGECCNRLSILLPYSSSNPHLLTLLLLSHNNNSLLFYTFCIWKRSVYSTKKSTQHFCFQFTLC